MSPSQGRALEILRQVKKRGFAGEWIVFGSEESLIQEIGTRLQEVNFVEVRSEVETDLIEK